MGATFGHNKGYHGNGRRDVTIHAPIAGAAARNDYGQPMVGMLEPPTPEEVCAMLGAENRQLQAEVKQREVAAGTMAAIALCFAQILVDHGIWVDGDRTVKIPAAMYRRMHGYVITASTEAVTNDGDVIVRIRERADGHGWET